jgi:trk system potassium uptake protein TrkH
MPVIVKRFPFFIELLFNGTFILLYQWQRLAEIKLPFFTNVNMNLLLSFGAKGVPVIIFIVMVWHYLQMSSFEDFLRKHIFSLIVFAPLVITWGDNEFCYWLACVHLLASALSLYEGDESAWQNKGRSFFKNFKLQSAQIVILTFMALIITGTLLLMLPISSASGKAFAPIDALFMATSATCVTGLGTLNINTEFSIFGQVVLLMLVQVGGLGIMILYASMTILLGKFMPMRERVIIQELLEVSSLEDLIDMILNIIKYTIAIEFWGAVILTLGFSWEGFDFGTSLYYGFYHSISAFCNAGFALFDNNLESFATTPLIHGTISGLIVLGGLGFIVLRELKAHITSRKSFTHLGLHSKIVIVTTAGLIVSGTLIVFFGEFLHALDGYNLWEKFQISIFQSITCRTAGFNTIPLTSLNGHTLYLMIMIMFIGAAPGSTGGGIKVSTFAILLQSIKSTLNGKDKVEIFESTIPNFIVVKATALTIISVFIATFFIFLMMKLEPNQTFLSLCFEVISAGATVGLSLGITPFLTPLGKLAIVAMMFIGRVGPLTLVLALGRQDAEKGQISYTEGRVMIG